MPVLKIISKEFHESYSNKTNHEIELEMFYFVLQDWFNAAYKNDRHYYYLILELLSTIQMSFYLSSSEVVFERSNCTKNMQLTIPQVRKENGCWGIDSNKSQNIVKCTILHSSFPAPLSTLNDASLQCFSGDSSALYELEAIDFQHILLE
ncbi:hypothetical protein T10_1440 [Trichinella papuae]|uniref:Uncharacterized protein n=1 Tax=Trichinella papuae TaxID=268474 RepID=A0A0V1N8T3_9BILA|nr:hypothetical protein T10_1440 [Trichinella papuae]